MQTIYMAAQEFNNYQLMVLICKNVSKIDKDFVKKL